MRFFTLIAVFLVTAQAFAQDAKGYYINSSGRRVEGLFAYGDYNDTPLVKFKELRNAQFTSLPADVVEYGIYEDKLKFEEHTVNIDISGSNSSVKEPTWQSQTIFLNVIVKGNASLYSYTKDYTTKYFFTTEGKPDGISQLVYKKYKQGEGVTAENVTYKQQLYNAVNCHNEQQVSDYQNIGYNKKQFADFFTAYNNCVGGKTEVFGPKKKSDFKYTAVVGLYNTTLGVPYAFPEVSDGSDFTYGVGIEAAYVFSSETVELVFRAELESLKVKLESSKDLGYNITTSIYDVDALAANIYIGPRYNFILNSENKIFVDAAFGASIPFGDITQSTLITPPSGPQYWGVSSKYDLEPGFSINFGVGYAYKAFGIALKYETNRDFLDNTASSYKTKISRFGVNLRYTFN